MFFSFKSSSSVGSLENAKFILFYGTGCPHCEIVEEFIKKNNIHEKLDFPEVEVFFNKDNAAVFAQKAKECGLDEKNLGVPLFWAEGKCYSGDKDIISYLSDKQ